jgi:hypothetical protein
MTPYQIYNAAVAVKRGYKVGSTVKRNGKFYRVVRNPRVKRK